jgi:hypothetical protein
MEGTPKRFARSSIEYLVKEKKKKKKKGKKRKKEREREREREKSPFDHSPLDNVLLQYI